MLLIGFGGTSCGDGAKRGDRVDTDGLVLPRRTAKRTNRLEFLTEVENADPSRVDTSSFASRRFLGLSGRVRRELFQVANDLMYRWKKRVPSTL